MNRGLEDNEITRRACRLCRKADEPLRHSHIIPEFLHKNVYSSGHKTVGIDPRPDRGDRVIQKGIREHLLCDSCEARFSRWETYAAQIIEDLPQALGLERKVILIRDVKYREFKLFQLSLLWRCSVAKHLSFSQVNLGPHEDILRRRLLEDSPGRSWEYGCILSPIRDPDSAPGVLVFLQATRLGGHRFYSLIARNLRWYFVVSSHARRIRSEPFLSEAGVLPLQTSSQTAKDVQWAMAGTIQQLRKSLS